MIRQNPSLRKMISLLLILYLILQSAVPASAETYNMPDVESVESTEIEQGEGQDDQLLDELLGEPLILGSLSNFGPLDDTPEPHDCKAAPYCTTEGCNCRNVALGLPVGEDGDGGEEGGPVCICDNDCPCMTVDMDKCKQPDKCTYHIDDFISKIEGIDHCLCVVDAVYCICPVECKCQMPDISVEAITFFGEAAPSGPSQPAEPQVMESGVPASFYVQVGVSSAEAVFTNLYFTTYIEAPLVPFDIYVEGDYSLVSTVTENGYTAIKVRSTYPNSDSFGGLYQLKAVFPSGTTPDGVSGAIYTVIEGSIIELTTQDTWNFDASDNKSIHYATALACAETEWSVKLSNVDLDYKNPQDLDDDKLFRYQVDLKRDPPTATASINLRDDAVLQVRLLPDDLDFPGGIPMNALEIVRVTDPQGEILKEGAADENSEYSYNPETFTLTFNAKELFGGWTKNTLAIGDDESQMTTDFGSIIYIVFRLSDNFLHELPVAITVGDFRVYENLYAEAEFSYSLVTDTEQRLAMDKTELQIIDYVPGRGSGGSIYKHSEAFIEGAGFFKEDTEEGFAPIKFSIDYVNNSNTSITNLQINDVIPAVYSFKGGQLTEERELSQYLRFTKVTLESWNASTYSGNAASMLGTATCTLRAYSDATTYTDIPLSNGSSAKPEVNAGENPPAQCTDLYIMVDGELHHGFKMQLSVEVAGDPDLADPDNNLEETRNKISFVRNRAEFRALSTKVPIAPLYGASSFMVHVYPFDTKDEYKVWNLMAAARSSDGDFAGVATIIRGREVIYRLTAQAEDENQYIYDPVFYLELPLEVTYKSLSVFGSASNLELAGNVVPNPLGPGHLLIIESQKKELLNPSSNAVIEVHCTLAADAQYGAIIESRAFFGIKDSRTHLDPNALYGSNTVYTLSYVEPNLTVPEKDYPLLATTVQIKVNSSGRLEGELWVQSELDNGVWHRHPEVAKALPGGKLTYKWVVRNGGTTPAGNIVLYNVFSNVNDQFIIGGNGRESMWQPYLTDEVRINGSVQGSDQTMTVNAVVYYSDTSDHSVTISGAVSGNDDWTLTPYQYTGVQALKVVLSEDFVLPSGAYMEIEIPMYAPVDFAIDTKEPSNNQAISSLATQFKFTDEGARLQALEPLKVTVELIENVKGEISGKVWGDTSKDNIWQQEDPLGLYEYPLGQVPVVLYDQSGSLLKQTVTDSEGNYKFTNLDDGNYQLRVMPPSGYSSAAPNTTDSMNAFTPYSYGNYTYYDFTIAPDNKVIEQIYAALIPQTFTISGNVWRSIDGVAERSKTIEEDIDLGGVSVAVYRMLGKGQLSLVATTVSNASDSVGSYSFSDVPLGRYVVVFTPLTNYTFAKRMDPPTTVGQPSRADFSQAQPDKNNAAGEMYGQSYEIWLQNDTTDIDCGLVPARGSISGTIWHDLDGDGARDSSSDPSLGSVVVYLYKTTDNWDIQIGQGLTATTDCSGNYSFTNLTPGNYEVRLDTVSERLYASFIVSGGSDTVIDEEHRSMENKITGLNIKPEDGDMHLNYTFRNFGLVQPFSISGCVFLDRDADEKYDESIDEGFALKTNGITLIRTAGNVTGTTYYSSKDIDGTFVIDGLWPGSYTLVFEDETVQGLVSDPSCLMDNDNFLYDDYLVLTPDDSDFSRQSRSWTMNGVASGQNQKDKNLALHRPRTIKGLVWFDRDGNGANDSGTSGSSEIGMTNNLTLKKVVDSSFGPLSTQNNVDTGYSFAGLYPGEYTVTVARDSYMITNTSTNLVSDGVYSVRIPCLDQGSDFDPKEVNFGLAEAVQIKGKIWHDRDIDPDNDYSSDGVFDGTGGTPDLPLKLANVAKLYRHNGSDFGSTPLKTVSSGDNGEYLFSDLLPGTYRVEFAPAAATYFVTGPSASSLPLPSDTDGATSAKFTYGENAGTWESIQLYSGESLGELNLSLGRYATISGVLWHDLDGDGIKDIDTEGIFTQQGYKISLHRNDASGVPQQPVSKDTDAGKYSFSKLKPGAYSVVWKPGPHRVTNQSDDNFILAGSDAASRTATWWVYHDDAAVTSYTYDFFLSVFANIEGKVWIDKNADAVCDDDETYLSGATVSLEYTDGPDTFKQWFASEYPSASKSVTLTDKSFAFTDLWPGTYTVTLSGSSGYLQTNLTSGDDAKRLSLSDETLKAWEIVVPSDVSRQAYFGLVKPSTLRGTVWRDSDGNEVFEGVESEISGTEARLERIISNSQTQQSYNMSSTITSPADLDFSFANLYPGSYQLTLQLPHDSTWLRTYFNTAPSLTTGSGGATVTAYSGETPYRETKYLVKLTDNTGDGVVISEVNFGYAKPNTIRGISFFDKNNSGTRDDETEEYAISAITAAIQRYRVSDNSYAPFAPVTILHSGGEYILSDLLPGIYRVTFAGHENYLVTTPDATSVMATGGNSGYTGSAAFGKASPQWLVHLEQDEQSMELLTGFVTPCSITGEVWQDLNADGTKDPDEPLYNQTVTVTLYDADGAIVASKPLANGTYTFEKLYPGNYTVEVGRPTGGVWYFSNTGSDIRMNIGEHETNVGDTVSDNATVSFGVTQPFSIAGKVWHDKTADGQYIASDDLLLGRVSVSIYAENGIDALHTTTTDGNGSYIFDDLLPGVYAVRFVDTTYADYVITNSYADTGDANQYLRFEPQYKEWQMKRLADGDITDCDFGLSEKTVVRGIVWLDRDGDGECNDAEPVPEELMSGVQISIYRSDDGSSYGSEVYATVNTSDSGFMFALAETGYYRLQITLPDTSYGVTNLLQQAIYRDIHVGSLGLIFMNRDFGLAQYVAFSGRAWAERNGNGTYESANLDETLLSGHGVTLRRWNVLNSTYEAIPNTAPVTTSASGSFEVTVADKVLPGLFTVDYAAKTAYLVTNSGADFDVANRLWSFALTSNATRADLDCAFTPERSLGGIIWSDANGDGVYVSGDTSEPMLQGYTVSLKLWNATSRTYEPIPGIDNATTYADGKYSFGSLYPGTYSCTIIDPGYMRRTNPDSPGGDPMTTYFVLDDTVAYDSLTKDFGLALPVHLAGKAFIDKDDNAVFDSTDLPVWVNVLIERAQGPDLWDKVGELTTDEAGNYNTVNLSGASLLPGDYRVTFTEMTDHRAVDGVGGTDGDFDVTARQWQITLATDQSRDDLNIGYQRNRFEITGFVWRDENGDVVFDPEETIFAVSDAAAVTLYRNSQSTVYTDHYLEPDGSFTLALTHAGSYALETILPSGYGVTNRLAPYDREHNLFLAELTYDTWQAHLPIGAALQMQVGGYLFMDANGDGNKQGSENYIDNTEVRLIGSDGFVEAIAYTDASGIYSFANVKPGTYSVVFAALSENYCFTGYQGDNAPASTVSSFDLRSGTWQLTLSDQNILNANSGYCAPSSIAGTLLDETKNQLLANQQVVLYRMNGDKAELWMTATTDANGAYSFGNLLPGSYQLRVQVPDGYKQSSGDEAVQQGNTLVLAKNIAAQNSHVDISSGVHVPRTGGYVPPNNTTPPGTSAGPSDSGSTLQSGENAPLEGGAPVGTELGNVESAKPDGLEVLIDAKETEMSGQEQGEAGTIVTETTSESGEGQGTGLGPIEKVEEPIGPIMEEVASAIVTEETGTMLSFFMDSTGRYLENPGALRYVEGSADIYVEFNDMEIPQYWRRFQEGDKYIFVLLDDEMLLGNVLLDDETIRIRYPQTWDHRLGAAGGWLLLLCGSSLALWRRRRAA